MLLKVSKNLSNQFIHGLKLKNFLTNSCFLLRFGKNYIQLSDEFVSRNLVNFPYYHQVLLIIHTKFQALSYSFISLSPKTLKLSPKFVDEIKCI